MLYRHSLRIRTLPAVGAVCFALLTLTGCETLAPAGTSSLSNDVYEIRRRLDAQIEDQASADRQMQQLVGLIRQNLESHDASAKELLDALTRMVREHNEAITQIRQETTALSMKLDTLDRRLSMAGLAGGGGSSTMGGTISMPGASGPGSSALSTDPMSGASSTGNGGMALNQVISSATNQFNLQNFAEARTGFEQALSMEPTGDARTDVLFMLAESQQRLGDLDAAEQTYNQVIDHNSQHVKAWVSVERIADLKVRRNRYEDALSYYNYIVNVYPDYPEIDRVRRAIAQIRQAQGGGGSAPPAMPNN